MEKLKLGIEEFAATVGKEDVDFVKEMHDIFTAAGCKLEIKEAKNGYVASYLHNKKTVANYVFRKKGLLIRIYANHLMAYIPFLDTLPASMAKEIAKAPDCKRLLNPNDCNPKCAMGYDFILNGGHYQKCRYNAFFFLISKESKPFIKEFIEKELAF